jgi:hypothetical protein
MDSRSAFFALSYEYGFASDEAEADVGVIRQ